MVPPPTTAAEEALTWEQHYPYYLVCQGVNKDRRYHAKMRAFYETLHAWVMSANALLGAGAFVALFGGHTTVIAQVLIGVVAAGSALDKTLGIARKVSVHDSLCRRYTALAAKISEWDPTPANHKTACAERLRIEQDAPTERRLVDLQSHNEELRSCGYPPHQLIPLSRLQQSWLGYVATFGMSRLERWLDQRSAS